MMLPRFHYEDCELECGDDAPREWAFVVFDRNRGSEAEVARCEHRDDAERIVEALNGPRRPRLMRAVPPCPVPLLLPCPVPLPPK